MREREEKRRDRDGRSFKCFEGLVLASVPLCVLFLVLFLAFSVVKSVLS